MREVSNAYKEMMNQKIREKIEPVISVYKDSEKSYESVTISPDSDTWKIDNEEKIIPDKNLFSTFNKKDNLASFERDRIHIGDNLKYIDQTGVYYPSDIYFTPGLGTKGLAGAGKNPWFQRLVIYFDEDNSIPGLFVKFLSEYPTYIQIWVRKKNYSSYWIKPIINVINGEANYSFGDSVNCEEISIFIGTHAYSAFQRVRIEYIRFGDKISIFPEKLSNVTYTDEIDILGNSFPLKSAKVDLIGSQYELSIENENGILNLFDKGNTLSMSCIIHTNPKEEVSLFELPITEITTNDKTATISSEKTILYPNEYVDFPESFVVHGREDVKWTSEQTTMISGQDIWDSDTSAKTLMEKAVEAINCHLSDHARDVMMLSEDYQVSRSILKNPAIDIIKMLAHLWQQRIDIQKDEVMFFDLDDVNGITYQLSELNTISYPSLSRNLTKNIDINYNSMLIDSMLLTFKKSDCQLLVREWQIFRFYYPESYNNEELFMEDIIIYFGPMYEFLHLELGDEIKIVYEIQFNKNESYFDLFVMVEDIKISGKWPNKEIPIRITIYKGRQVTRTEKIQLSSNGESITYDNPALNNINYATEPAVSFKIEKSLKKYYSDRNSVYDMEYRGDLSIEAGDVIRHINTAGDSVKCVVEKHELNFGSGKALSGNLTTRKL